MQIFVCMPRRRLTRSRVAQAFGQALVRSRLHAKMTQEQLADAAKLHQTTIALFERGLRCPSLDTVFHLADAMNVDPVSFINLVENEAYR